MRDLNQTDVGNCFGRVQVKERFINELAADASVTDGQIFEVHQPFQMDAHLRQAPAASVAQFSAAKGGSATGHRCLLTATFAFRFHHVSDVGEQAARLRRQFIERTAQHFRR